MKRNKLFNFKQNPTCPECGSTNVSMGNTTFEVKPDMGFTERANLVCDDCNHAWTLRYEAKLVGYKPADNLDEESGEIIEAKEEKVK